jgi:glycosyltransferase involved in cell wall biosynthesis
VRARYGLDPGYVLHVGALQPRKNATALIDAFAGLDGGELVLVGRDRGGLDAVRERIAAHGLEPRVRLLGHVPEADLPAVYGAARVLCMPSLYEGFGLPVLEAMACGTPVVASATTALGEAVGDAGLTVDPESVAAIRAALAGVLGDDGLHERLREAGLRRASEFTWERAAGATADVYRAALG